MKKAIVLAAGEGTRMKSNTPKVLHRVLGVSMLRNVIDELRKTDIEEIIVIVGHQKDDVIDEIKDLESIKYEVQPIGKDYPYGTGYAVAQGVDYIEDEDEVLILCGDTPLLRGSTLKEFINSNSNLKASVLTASVENNTGYGRIIKDEDGFVLKIVEEKDANEEEKKIQEINSGVYTFNGKALKDNLKRLNTNNSQGELYLTDIVDLINKDGEKVGSFQIEDNEEILGVNSRIQLLQCENILKNRINNHWLNEGVTILDPSSTIIGPKVKIGIDTIIYPGARILGDTEIGSNNIIEGDTSIVNSKIGNNNYIKSTYITESEVKNNVTIGPFAQLRPNTVVEDNAHIGNFVELKKSTFGKGSKAGHLAYIGDAQVGENVNIGCGVITVNYDGIQKHLTKIEDGAFIGSNANLVAPVNIGKNGFVACGSTITKDVGEDDLAIERNDQVNIVGWVKRKYNK